MSHTVAVYEGLSGMALLCKAFSLVCREDM